MTTSAWLFMLVVWAVIVGFTAYCFYRLLTSEQQLGTDGDEPQQS
jgi:hypothetical protein